MNKLNKKEIKFFKDLFEDIYNEEKMKELLRIETLKKQFLNELKRLERKGGFNVTKCDVTSMIGYFGEDYEVIEEYVYCFQDNIKEGAKAYFESRY